MLRLLRLQGEAIGPTSPPLVGRTPAAGVVAPLWGFGLS